MRHLVLIATNTQREYPYINIIASGNSLEQAREKLKEKLLKFIQDVGEYTNREMVTLYGEHTLVQIVKKLEIELIELGEIKQGEYSTLEQVRDHFEELLGSDDAII